MSDDDEVIRETILRYLRARRAIEIEIHRLMDGPEDTDPIAAFETAKPRFEAYRAIHLAPESVLVMTSSPAGTVVPEGIEWRTVKVTGDEARACTRERADRPDGMDTYEYRLERRDGRWLLTDRRWHVPGTRAHWIKGLL